MQMLYRLSYVGLLRDARGGQYRTGRSLEDGYCKPTLEASLRIQAQKDALPRADLSSEKAVGK